MSEELDKQVENKPERDEHGRLLPGNTANPNGRPKGKTLKEYQAERFRTMSDEEKEKWIIEQKISGIDLWRMSEGNPHQSGDADLNLIFPKPIDDVSKDDSIQENKEVKE
jgi:hypothetical protein